MSNNIPADLAYEDMLWITQRGFYWQVAATVIALYDHITTFDLEVELIWKKKLSIVQVLYFINRYSGDALFIHGTTYQLWLKGDAFYKGYAFHPDSPCMSAQTVQMWLSMITLWAMQGIIINRLWCMYRYSKTILVLLLVTFTIQVAAGITIQSLNKTINIVVPLLPGLDSCIPTGFLPWFWAVLLFIMTFDLLIVILAILEGIRFYRGSAHSRALRNKARGPLSTVLAPWLAEGSIVRVLLRDSILFPFIGLAVCFFAMLSWLEVLPWGSVQVTMVLNALTAPVLGSRLILNLRDAYYQPFAEEAGGKEGPSRYTGATSTTGKLRTVEFPMSYTSTATKTGHISYGTNETVNT